MKWVVFECLLLLVLLPLLTCLLLSRLDLGKLAGSSALNEVKFTCGVCKKPYFISAKSSRTTQGKVNYFKISKFKQIFLIYYYHYCK